MLLKRPFELRPFLFAGLRRLSYRYPSRSKCLQYYRIRRGWYKCAICKGDFRKCDVAIDHIDPVVNPRTGFRTWDEYIERLFCSEHGLQVLCNTGNDSCHKIKTKAENLIRKEVKKNGRRPS